MDRRTLLNAAVGGVAGALAPLRAAPAAAGVVALPDLSFLRETPLANAERLRDFMGRARLDALVATHPANVFYLTNHWPQLDRMGLERTTFAVFARDPARPLALVMHAFLYYYTHSDEVTFGPRLVFPYTQPAAEGAASRAEGEPAAEPPRMLRVVDEELVGARERRRRAALAAARESSAGPDWALAKAVRELGLERARLGTDDPLVEQLLAGRGIQASCVSGENTLRRARLSKTEPELRLMRLASAANVAAGIEAARAARAAGTSRGLRASFFAEAARRGNSGVFMVIDGSSSELLDAPLQEGTAFSIDCVSSCRHYHGDFARSVFVGEPRKAIQRAVAGTLRAWQDVRSQLKAGMRFAEIPRLGRESLRKQGLDVSVSFNPHSVGIFHTDHPLPLPNDPQPAAPLVLEEGMVLSVDCPLLDAGLGGSSHLEDLMLIRSDGAEPIHDVPPNVIQV